MDARTADTAPAQGQSAQDQGSVDAGQAAAGSAGFLLALRFAMRELRGGLRGFYVFLTCIALGVAAISGVNSVAGSITSGIAEEGQKILGGDVSASLVQRELDPQQLAFLESYGAVTKSTTLRTMARKLDGSDQTLVELKAVDDAYPLYGTLEGEAGSITAEELGGRAIAMEGLLGERLGLQTGDQLKLGAAEFTISDGIVSEPDRLGENFGFGPRVLMSMEALKAADLVKPGSLVRHTWRVRFDDASPANVKRFAEQARERFPDAGWRLRSRENAAPALSRNIERFSDFLTLVGLTALIVGGVGVANAVRAFLEAKRPVIATFKSLGAPGGFIFNVYLVQILLIAAGGILIGLALGALMPALAGWALAGVLPLPQSSSLAAGPLVAGAIYGFLTALVFAIWPLAIAREVPATDLFRGQGGIDFGGWPKAGYLLALAACVALLVGLAILTSENRYIASVFVGAIAFAFVLLRVVALLIQLGAKSMPHARSTELRMAVANIHRPGALTPSVVLSLGLGLALLVALALIDGNLRRQVSDNLPERAPDFFFVDIQNGEKDAFETLLSGLAPDGKVFSVPMLRGRITELRGIRTENYPVGSEGGWVLRGDRGITYARNIPENSTLSKGTWWPEDYDGEPLVSFSAEEAGELGLDVGDPVTVNVLGRNITARIASLRNVEWETLAINFVMVFSPNTFAGAPHAHLATLTLEDNVAQDAEERTALDARDGAIVRAIAAQYPAVTTVRVREALDTVNRLIGQLATAIRSAAAVALIASVLVLGGALAAGNRARVHDAVVLKTLGATRGRLVRAFVYEYAILGLVTAVFALAAGSAAAWFVVSRIMEFSYTFDPAVAGFTVLAALMMTVGFGLIGTWRILGRKAAPVLREL